MMKKEIVLTAAMMLFSMVASTTFVSATEVYPKEYNTEGTITFEAGDEGVTPPVDPENPDPNKPVDPSDPPSPGTGGHYRLIMDQNSNLGLKKFLLRIKRIMQLLM